jgi:hypothetical protein
MMLMMMMTTKGKTRLVVAGVRLWAASLFSSGVQLGCGYLPSGGGCAAQRVAWQRVAWQGRAGHGSAWHGRAGQGMAYLALASMWADTPTQPNTFHS